jgi:uncharacterized protein (TIGR02246 family)
LPTSRIAPGVLLPFVVLLAACRIEPNPVAEVVPADSVARADIRATQESWRSALLANDPDAVASFYAPDARVYEPAAGDIIGASGVESAVERFLGKGGVVTGATVEPEEIHVDGPLAFELGTFENRFRIGDEPEATVRGRYMIRWRRGPEARWLIDRLLLNHYPSPAATDSAGPGA